MSSLIFAVQYMWIVAGVLSFVFCIGWPVLTIPAGVFSLSYFSFFVILSLIWALVSPIPSPCMHAGAGFAYPALT